MSQSDPRLSEAKALPIAEVAALLNIGNLKRAGQEQVGPCPVCGGVDRFGLNATENLFNCRHCGGGDGIKLVQLVRGCEFKDALSFLCGEAELVLDPAEQEKRRKRAQASAEKREREADKYREAAIMAAKKIWAKAVPAAGTLVEDYLALRGLNLKTLPNCLRFIAQRKYYQQSGHSFENIHTGPCMIAAVQRPDRELCAVHQTWLDLDEPGGKAKICARDGTVLDAKKLRGSKRGAAIRLHTPTNADTLIMGEGLETTLTALVAEAAPNAAYWAGIDLGHMSGRMQRVPGKRYSGLPEMADEAAFVPPPWVRRLIFIQDGDSEPKMTRAKLEAGLIRAQAVRPGVTGKIVHAGMGRDLNDILMGARHG